MRQHTRVLINVSRRSGLVVLLLALASMLSAQTAVDPNPRNAAYWYERAVEQLDSISDEQWNMLTDHDAIMREPSPEVRSALRSLEPTLALLRRGSAQQYSDYGLDLSKGFELMLPHLSKMRQAAKAMKAEALVKMHDGDVVGASRDLASLYRLGGHMADDRILISGLVAHAMFSLSDEAVQDAIDRGAIDSVAAAELAKGVLQLDEHDPFGYIESIFSEQELMTSTLDTMLEDEVHAQTTIELLTSQDDPQVDAIIGQLHASGIDTEMARLDATMNEVVEIFMLDDEDESKRRLNELEASIESGERGVFAQLVMPAYDRVHQRLLEARAMVAQRRTMLEQLARGELDPNSLANAAIIYQQANDAYDALPEQQRELIEALAAHPTSAVDDDTAAALDQASSVIDIMHQASQLRRCDFEPLRRNEQSDMLPAYTVGMHRLFELLHAEVIRQFRAGDGQALAQRLSIGYRMTAHLGADDVLVSALVAHQAFGDLTGHVRSGLSAGLLTDHRSAIVDAAQRITRRDPFGYINAVMESRKVVATRLRRLADEQAGFDRETIERLVNTWQGDELLFVLTALESLDQNTRANHVADGETAAAATLAGRMAPLDGIVSVEAVRYVQQGVGDLAPRLAMGSVDLITGLEIPSIGNWNQRMRRARADLRELYRLLGVLDDGGAQPAELDPPPE